MRLRITVSLLTLLCSWVLWEKWSMYGGEVSPAIQAVFEAKSLLECRGAMPDFIKEKTMGFKSAYKESEHVIIAGPYGVNVMTQGEKKLLQQYDYYCLPSTVDPYRR